MFKHALAPDQFQFSVQHLDAMRQLDLFIDVLMTRHHLCQSGFDHGQLFAGDYAAH